MKPPTLVVLAAGMGRRFGGDKQLMPVGPRGETMLDLNALDAAAAGFVSLAVVTRPELESDVEAALHLFAANAYDHEAVKVVLQEIPAGRRKPWGTADALVRARPLLHGHFAVCNADDLYGRGAFSALVRQFARHPDEAAVVGYPVEQTLSDHGAVSRARLEHDGDGLLERVTEEAVDVATATPGSLVSMNLWGFPAGWLEPLEHATSDAIAEGADEAFLPAIVNRLVEHEGLRVRVLPTTERWIGMTYAGDLERVRREVEGRS